ncbi:MAG: prepilin-type N-terminal cleavage/methylation domain-containing protein [Turicibacter sp.]|nr:prepilin-type N-terminal cleavage/methylation domain-containing protein [Turicibacter sp.]
MRPQESQKKSRKTVGGTLQSICVYKGKRKGLTLIEVIISLALFSLIAIPVFGFANMSVETNKKAELKQQAALLGQSIFEELGGIEQLIVGENDLFGKIVVISESCDESEYCTDDLEIDRFMVNIQFSALKKSSRMENIEFITEGSEVHQVSGLESTTGNITNSDGDSEEVVHPQQTKTLDLYEIEIGVYNHQSEELLFNGNRVLPLNFIYKEGDE